MSADQSDAALQRLNYFNGQRLAASDFRAEQGHHMGMRRVLNRSLYSPGIVVGLEVVPAAPPSNDPQDKHRVIVRHGLAFDHLGREIFLPVDVSVQVMGAPRSAPGVVFGNLLVVSYRESRKFPSQSQCKIGAPFRPCSGDLSWGAPTRIVADAVFEFVDSWPSDDSGKIVLSQIELDSKCKVVRTSPGVRRYAVPAKPQTARPISLEGEKDIDQFNPKVLHFHVDGGMPESVVLHLRSRPFSTLYYTELGRHTHAVTSTLSNDSHDYGHSHPVSGGKTTPNGLHNHKIWVDDGANAPGVDADTGDDWNDHILSQEGVHEHDLKDITLGSALNVYTHTHTINVSSASAGVSDLAIRSPAAPDTNTTALRYLVDLRVLFDETNDITDRVLQQLRSKLGQELKWPALGDSGVNALALPEGSGEIDLLKIPGLEIGLGRHTLTFRVVKPAVGGTLQYNLYVS